MKFLCTVLLLLFLHLSSSAVDIADYRFHKMPETSYYGGIHSIVKDSIGRIWFSGYDALYVYNGHSYIQMNELVTSHSPSSYWSYGQVVTDHEKRLYVATNHGLLRFDYKTQKFDRILTGNIGTIAVGDEGTIWLIRDGKIESFYPDQLPLITKYPLPSDLPISALICRKKQVFFSSGGKLYQLNAKTKRHHLFTDLGNPSFLIRDVIIHGEVAYLLTQNNGLFACTEGGKVATHYNLSSGYGRSASTKSLYLDASNMIWIATQTGLFLLNPQTNQIHLLRSNFHYAYSLPNNSVWSIYPDPDGGVWVGTYGGKLAYMTFYDNDVNYFKPTLGGLNHPIVSCFEEDNDGNLWIGTEGGGLNYWNRKIDHFSYYTQENNIGITSNMIKNLHYDKKNSLLQISTFNGGMEEFDRKNDRFVDLQMFHPQTSQQLSVYDFAVEGDSGIWMTNPDSELLYKDKKKGTTEVVSLRDSEGNKVRMRIETLFRNKGDNLWLMTHTGLYIVNVHTRRILKHYYIADVPYAVNNLCAYYATSTSDIWFGTRGGGANRLDKNGKYVNFGDKEGLMGKTVFGILEDTDSKNIWFSTNDGLYYYENSSKEIKKFLIDVPNLCGTFYVRSCFKTSKNEMLFGGTNGFIMFTPSKIKQNNQKPKVFFTDLLINNKKIIPQEENSPISQDISTLAYTDNKSNNITLSHKQANIEIRLSANSYLQAEKNQFSYRMSGLSDKWYTLPAGQKAVQFFNMPAGKYLFEVKAANNDGLWGDEISRLSFEVTPSPFFSIWAYLIYMMIFLSIIYFIWQYFTNKKVFKHQLEMEYIKEQNMKKLTQARINFFTNISHDLKTPLTLVVDPLKQLKELLPQYQASNANTYVLLIEKNVNRIQRMISQLLQFREIESQKITMNKQPGDLVQYIKGIFSLFELYANKKGIEMNVVADVESFYTKFDPDIMEKIFTNLFSNAIKYTTENGFVAVHIVRTNREELATLGLPTKHQEQYLSIAVTNTGIEIPAEKREQIFESFNRLASGKLVFESSTGLGLTIVKELVHSLEGRVILESRDGKTTFSVILPFTVDEAIAEGNQPSYEYTISEIDNILGRTENVHLSEKRTRKASSVVIIEDDLDLRNYMEKRLSERFNTYTAVNGKEGIAKAEKIFPQVVITDLMMPEADGFDVCRKLRSNIKTSHIPIVVLSALGKNTENKIKALESGANVFIDKPFDMDFLLKQVDNLIKNQNELRESYSKKYIAEPSKVTISSTDEELLKRAMEHIENNISNMDYNVETFVSDMGVGRTLLYQKINDILGMSIKEFIMDIRLKRGAQLLAESDLTIAEISYAIGFNNPKHFSVCFKKQFDLTPSEFRKKS
ncbi:hybrid sensor histidine kinase/response regulator transcription factor [Sphingobacterium sp. LRF_L2]|uniref:hybrid sensor histidine kinase/response regulator transcription factor n=1 Tax=Sphingobacterium sp. LRF_L2 TaxID=3369421 RepID=UPI003F634532